MMIASFIAVMFLPASLASVGITAIFTNFTVVAVYHWERKGRTLAPFGPAATKDSQSRILLEDIPSKLIISEVNALKFIPPSSS